MYFLTTKTVYYILLVNEVTILLHYVIITRDCITAWMLKNNELKTAAALREARCDFV